jgi:glycosyltransferase involved in cell wall biosynthesis
LSKSVAIIGTRGYPSYYGGFETAVRRLAPYLVEAGWDVVVYGRSGATLQEDPTRDPRITVVETRGVESKSFSTLSYGFTASLNAAIRKPDVALVMNVANGYFLPMLKLRGVPTLVNVDGIEWHRAKWGSRAKKVFRIGARMTKWFGDELVYDSHEIARRWKSTFDRDGVFIPYGGDVPPEYPVEPGLKHREYVLVVARFVPENSIPEFLDAAEEISRALPVVIVGSSGYGGPLEERVRELAERVPKIHWLGHISDDERLLSLWQHAAVYFHGHSVGGTNPTLVQAMATRTPIVARDTAYNREVLGDGARYCEPSPRAIAKTVTALAEDRAGAEALADESFRRSREIYTWDRVCEAYAEALERLIGGRSK